MTHGDENDDKIINPGSSNSNTNHDNPKKSSTNSNSNDTRACAACKYQRRRCAPDCPLAPYFPPDHQKHFLNAHKLFGLRNMMKVYKRVKPNERDLAMKSMIFEANMRAQDPVGGCYRIIEGLQNQIQLCKADLSSVLNRLAPFQNLYNANSAVATTAPVAGDSKEPIHVNPNTVSTGHVAPQSMQFQPDSDEFGRSYLDFYPAALEATYNNDGVIQAMTSRSDFNAAEPLLGDGSEQPWLLGDGSGMIEAEKSSRKDKDSLIIKQEDMNDPL